MHKTLCLIRIFEVALHFMDLIARRFKSFKKIIKDKIYLRYRNNYY